jgi:hypothetical protein
VVACVSSGSRRSRLANLSYRRKREGLALPGLPESKIIK